MKYKLLNFKLSVLIPILFFGLFGLAKGSQAATTYYIDFATGNDANNGTSTSTPWQHAPGMIGCSNTCGAYVQDSSGTTGAGNRFIFKGGVTWPLSVMCWEFKGSGTLANPIYFGVDKTWYTGASWSRPILDAQGGAPSINPSCGSDTSCYSRAMFRAVGDFVVIDNFEFKGLADLLDYAGTSDDPIPAMLAFGRYPSNGGEIKSCYFHGWSHGGTATRDTFQIIASAAATVDSSGHDMNMKIHDNVFDGSDTSGDMITAAYRGSAGHFYRNYISDVTNGVCCYSVQNVWGNTFKNIAIGRGIYCPTYDSLGVKNDCVGSDCFSFDCHQHGNTCEAYQAGGTAIYNNFLENIGGGATVILYPNDSDKDYIFNNVVVNDGNQTLQLSSKNMTSGNTAGYYTFNNTFQNPVLLVNPTNPINFGNDYSIYYAMTRNNYLISSNTTINWGTITTNVNSNNTTVTNAQATSAGYVSTGTYPFFPPATNAGYNLASFCSSIPTSTTSPAATACLSDTTLGVAYDSSSHTVTGDGKVATSRGSSWDIGAYEYASGSSDTTPPVAPSGLSVQ